MSRKGNPVTYLSRNLCTVLVASLLLLALPSSAGATSNDDADQTNTVNLTIQGGDARALATCLNIAKQENRAQSYHARWWDDEHRWDDGRRNANKWQDRRAFQENECENKAYAAGGTVILKNVDILAVQDNKDRYSDVADQENTVNLTIRGGDATALATCLNIAKERGDDSARQENNCQNTAVATGGSVILKNVDITIVQTNKA